jgi:hypothetical protein
VERVITMAWRAQLPSIRQFGATIPGSIAHRIDHLYQAMAALDFRIRSMDFISIFRQIDICVLLLRNQAKYDAWRAAKRQRATARGARQNPRMVTP